MTNEQYKSTTQSLPYSAVLKRIFDIHCEGEITDEQVRHLVDSVHVRIAAGEIDRIASNLIGAKTNNPQKIRNWIT